MVSLCRVPQWNTALRRLRRWHLLNPFERRQASPRAWRHPLASNLGTCSMGRTAGDTKSGIAGSPPAAYRERMADRVQGSTLGLGRIGRRCARPIKRNRTCKQRLGQNEILSTSQRGPGGQLSRLQRGRPAFAVDHWGDRSRHIIRNAGAATRAWTNCRTPHEPFKPGMGTGWVVELRCFHTGTGNRTGATVNGDFV